MKLKFLLDTDTVSFALRGMGGVRDRLLQEKPSSICISSVSLAELRFGAERRNSRRLHRLIDDFVAAVQVAAFDPDSAERFGTIACHLADSGTPIGQMDTLIAAHALALDVVLVTNRTRDFGKVPGLRTANWL